MRRIALALLLALTLGQLAVAASATPVVGSISGLITERETSRPVAGACVLVRSKKSTEVYFGESDSTGAYAVSDVPDGTYQAEVRQPCAPYTANVRLARQWYPGVDRRADATDIVMDHGVPHVVVNVSLPPTSVVTGTLRDSAGHVVVGERVRVESDYYRTCAVTDRLGRYRAEGVSPEAVLISFAECDGSSSRTYAPIYYGQTRDSVFKLVPVPSNTTVSGIDGRVLRWAHLRGVIVDGSGHPPRDGGVFMLGTHGGSGGSAAADAAGRWSGQVLPGSYQVLASPGYVPGGVSAATWYTSSGRRTDPPTTITVKEGQTSPVLRITTPLASRLVVHVTDSAGHAVSGATVVVTHLPHAGDDWSSIGSGAGMTTGAEGSVEFQGWGNDTYRVEVTKPGMPTTYFGNTNSVSAATPLTIHLGRLTSVVVRMAKYAPRQW